MDKDKQISERKTTYITSITNLQTPNQVKDLVESMIMDTHKTCIARSFDTPSIMTLGRNEATRKGYVLSVKFMLVKLDTLLNVRGFEKAQLDEIPNLLLTHEFSELRLNDINFICRSIATSRYPKGGLFGKMDVQTFFSCVREYMADDERISAREAHHRQSHLSKIQATEQIQAMPEEFIDEFKKKKNVPTLKLDEVKPLFKVTDKDSVKKLRTNGTDTNSNK